MPNTLDKNLMFEKIMPSSQRKTSAAEASKTPSQNESQTPSGPTEESLRSNVFARAEETDRHNAQSIVNIMELLVIRYMDDVLLRFNCCRCNRCKKDIAASALNSLPSKYMVAEAEQLEKAQEQEDKKKILEAIIRAVLVVRAHPRH